MAAAVCKLFDNVKLDIGPSTDEGFYYDFDLEHRIGPEDFPKIEAAMRELIQADVPFIRKEVSREEAAKVFADQPYKLERLQDIPEGETVSLYTCGDFTDLCRGPHVASTGCVGAVKITSVAGSYYRGDEKNKMLQRVYGMADVSQEALDAALNRIEEAKKRDHRKIGKELDLFSISEDVGPGLAHWHPKGARIRIAIEDYWRKEHFRHGYEMLFTPHVGRAKLWETSGHLGFYRDSMFPCMNVDEGEGSHATVEQYFVKPMNCPFHIQVYKTRRFSYRDLPLRWAELGTVYRYEKDGVRHGLFRVRGFTQDDAHIFCAPDKIEDEIRFTVNFCLHILHRFGFKDITAYLSTRPEKAVGAPEKWEQATNSLRQALEAENLPYEVDEGGGAFYGPKIDMKIKDALGREWQLGTIQFDFNLPERFNLVYIGEDGKEHQPYMVHRALLGSLERFFGILIEHYAGAFPTWLAPEQVRILPITDKQLDYAKRLETELLAADVRVKIDVENEKLGAKIRRAQLEKVPFMLVVGGRDEEAGKVSVRSREKGDLGAMDLDAFQVIFKKALKD
ncbi:MAG: threonine--tRNA ligase [Kiritimatiellae bacterium]|nr:threonine--tRNA ligase [Kiritimatiellia bacterium]MBP5319585.1 threonine--tRNA ligase [Kiritimatiellia bacterium]